jgi:hypothetical protein
MKGRGSRPFNDLLPRIPMSQMVPGDIVIWQIGEQESIPVRGESDNLFVKIMYVAADGLLYSQEIDVRYYVDLIGGDADG